MMKGIRIILCALAVLQLLFCTGCEKKALLYDSSGTQKAEASEEAFQTESLETREDGNPAEAQEPGLICVYVCGEVKTPGVYELPASSRIGEAVEAAGGMTEEAADTFLNLAEHMTDGQKIEVPSREDAKALKEQQEQQEGGLVNLNTAAKEQLMTLTGIGESKAEDILDYREQNGGFRTKEDLMQIPGIKERVFEKIKDQITV